MKNAKYQKIIKNNEKNIKTVFIKVLVEVSVAAVPEVVLLILLTITCFSKPKLKFSASNK